MQNKKAFTLVELIVVITILAILGTIAFISLQGYSKSARDSTRISDIGSMKKVLELYALDKAKYPSPDDYTNITYSGGVIWSQGTFGEEVLKNIQKISNIPLDPLTKTQYTYSVLNTGKEFEIGSIIEGELSKLNNLETKAAGETIGKSYITGNYNGKVAKTTDGTNEYILAVPSIISGDIALTDYYQIVSANKLSYNGVSVLPGSYTGTTMNTDGNGETIVKAGEIVIHKGDVNSIDSETFVNELQQAYSGTDIESDSQIADLLEISTPEEKNNYASAVVENELDGNVVSSGETSDGETGGTQTYQEMGLCDEPDITVGGITIAACNLGTTTAATAYNDSAGYGHYFQFGRNASYEDGTWTNGDSNYGYDWLSPGGTDAGSANLWGVSESEKTTAIYLNQSSSDQALMQGPCPDGYHIPTSKEWVDIIALVGATDRATAYNALKLPSAGVRPSGGGSVFGGNSSGYYWSVSPDSSSGYGLVFSSTNLNPINYSNRASGLSVRCFKN